MSTEITEDIGFYFAIFQRDMSGNLVKCWLDGSEDWTYFTKEEFLEKAQQTGYDIFNQIDGALSTFSLYIWDVGGKTINRLSSQGHLHGNLMQQLQPMQLVSSRNQNPFENDIKISRDCITFKL